MRHDANTEPPLAICRGNIVQAVYREPEISDHVGNPLEEALPPMLNADQLILRLQHFPTYEEAARKGAVGREQQNPASAVTAEVRASARDLKQSNLNVTVTSTWQPASDVTVTATYPYSISLLGLVVKSGRISSSTTERVE